MTTVRDDQSLSHLDVVVLARLSASKPPSKDVLAKDIATLLSPDPAGYGRDVFAKTLPDLRRRRLVNEPKLTKKGEPHKNSALERTLTAEGKRALRAALGVEKTPSWAEFKDKVLPALALGLRVGATDDDSAIESGESILIHLACGRVGVANANALEAKCDAMIRTALNMPEGPLTLDHMRAHMIAGDSSLQASCGVTDSLTTVAVRIGQQLLKVQGTDKSAIVRALSSRWVYTVIDSNTPPKPPVVLAADTLLNLVRDAIPQIGSDGRFGKEKVFVSAIWQRIEREHRLPDLSLDRFKRWLVTANRDQLLDLARADLVGAMDPRLVRDSEIEDRGATFHFVVDRRANGAQGHHAR